MTDDEYQRLLRALAAKHLMARGVNTDLRYLLQKNEELRRDLMEISASARVLKVIDRGDGVYPADDVYRIFPTLRERLLRVSPIERTRIALEDTGILAALEDAGSVVFAELRRQAIPPEDTQFLLEAGYTNDEIEILLANAIYEARSRATTKNLSDQLEDISREIYDRRSPTTTGQNLSDQLQDASELFKNAIDRLGAPPPPSEPKKRKVFNGIGKVLGGAITGVGNALMATGTIVAPNPATGAGAIASAAVAVPLIMGGIGDLRGE